jgi:hypothetical protein
MPLVLFKNEALTLSERLMEEQQNFAANVLRRKSSILPNTTFINAEWVLIHQILVPT